MKNYFKLILFAFSLVVVSCDKDFNSVGSDLVGDEHFNYEIDSLAEIKAYTKATGEVQTNNLPVNSLGIYKNDVFGTTTASFVTQVGMTVGNLDYGTNVEIRDVYLYVPFFVSNKVTDANGDSTYELDSIFSNNYNVDVDLGQLSSKRFKLSVFENGYFLQNSEPNGGIQKYYSDMGSLIESNKKGSDSNGNSVNNGNRLNDDADISQNDQFYFNKNEIKIYKKKTINSNYVYVDESGNELPNQSDETTWVVKERLSPGIYLKLNKNFFYKKFFDGTNPANLNLANMVNNNNFRNYFRGLYFKVEAIAGVEAAMAMLNFSSAKLSIDYSSISTGSTSVSDKTVRFNLGINSGNQTISLVDNNFKQSYLDNGIFNPENNSSNSNYGKNERLYLKGGVGSVVYMDLFGPDTNGNNISDQLELYKNKKWLINDAYIEFYIDTNVMNQLNKKEEPLRLYLFDATNQIPLIDFTADATVNTNSKFNKSIFGGTIDRENTSRGVKYKIRITNLINNLFNSTNENYNKNLRLGLCVSETISTTSNFYYKNPITILGQEIKYFPVGSIMSPVGTVIHGPNSLDVGKRLKLKIHYTEPN